MSVLNLGLLELLVFEAIALKATPAGYLQPTAALAIFPPATGLQSLGGVWPAFPLGLNDFVYSEVPRVGSSLHPRLRTCGPVLSGLVVQVSRA